MLGEFSKAFARALLVGGFLEMERALARGLSDGCGPELRASGSGVDCNFFVGADDWFLGNNFPRGGIAKSVFYDAIFQRVKANDDHHSTGANPALRLFERCLENPKLFVDRNP